MHQRTRRLLSGLRDHLDPGGLMVEAEAMAPFTSDWRGMFKGLPLAVAEPRTVHQVAAVVSYCFENNVAIVPAGGLTGLAGGATPDNTGHQLVLSLRNMNKVRSVDVFGETMIVEAGCILANAQTAAVEAGLLLPISLASEGSLQIGGAIATNAGGTNVLRYGMARNRVLGLEVVLANGVIIDGLRALQKDNAGLDWKHWFVGSEGALGIITAAVLKLAPATPFSKAVLAGYDTLDDAVQSLRSLRTRVGDCLTAFEVMQREAIDRSATHLGVVRPLTNRPWLVLIEASAAFSAIEQILLESCEFEMADGRMKDAIVAESLSQRNEIWRLRESISETERIFGSSIKHDVSIPIAEIPSFIREIYSYSTVKWPEVYWNIFGHLGDGNLHVNAMSAVGEKLMEITPYVHDTVEKYKGSISAEHGIGQYRVNEFRRIRTKNEIDIMVKMKSALDSKGILNPGKVF